MVELREVSDADTKKKRKTFGINTEYRGPGDDFPYMGFQILGATHILLGVAMEITAIVHMGITQWDRLYFLLTGSVSVWCPLIAIATGIVGTMMSPDRYWEIRCMKQTFLGLSLVTAFLFMSTLAIVTGFVDFYYYGMSDYQPMETFQQQVQSGSDSRVAMMWVIVGLACLEFLVCMVSACICCCCAPLYMEEDAEPVMITQSTPPPVYVEKPQPQAQTIYVEKPAPPQPIIIQKTMPAPQPQPVIVQQRPPQQVIYQQAPRPQIPAPIVLQAPAPRPMLPMLPAPAPVAMAPAPPPQPIYSTLPPQPIYGSQQPMYGSPMLGSRRVVRKVVRPKVL